MKALGFFAFHAWWLVSPSVSATELLLTVQRLHY